MYGVLLKKSLKESFSPGGKRRRDVTGAILSVLLTAALLFAVLVVLSRLSRLYVEIRMNGVSDPTARTVELMSFTYAVVFLIGVGDGIKNINFALFESEDRTILMTLPIKSSTIFYAKLTTVYIRQLVLFAVMIIAVNLALAEAVAKTTAYIVMTAVLIPIFPALTLIVSSILCFPVYMIKRALKSKYLVSLLLATAVLAILFYGYKYILEFIRELFTTGDIRFFFDDDVMHFMMDFARYSYPVNLMARCVAGVDMTDNAILLLAIAAAAFFAGFGVVALLYNRARLMRASSQRSSRRQLRKGIARKKGVFHGLLKKEFFLIYRTPSYAFQYFSVAVIMPLMVYFCMGIGEDLLRQLIMADAGAELGLFLVLTFGALTNTFAATNISRDGYAFYTLKAMPIKPATIVNAKVLFSAIVAVASILISVVVLAAEKYVDYGEAAFIFTVAVLMALAQIAFATRKDLFRPSFSPEEDSEVRESTNTVSQIIIIGFLSGILLGGLALFTSIFLSQSLPEAEMYVKLGSLLLSALLAAAAFTYLYVGLGKKLYRMQEGDN